MPHKLKAWTVEYARLAIANAHWLRMVGADPRHQLSWYNAAVNEGIVFG